MKKNRIRRKKRLLFIATGLAMLVLASSLILFNLRSSIAFYVTPHEIFARNISAGQKLRIGGWVLEGSLQRQENLEIRFVITDRIANIETRYRGILPDIFREGQGVVADGFVDKNGVFQASQILAKHDETYMPREILKKIGAISPPDAY